MKAKKKPEAISPTPVGQAQDPVIRRMLALGVEVNRRNYLTIVDPGANPDDLDAEVEASLPEELRIKDKNMTKIKRNYV